MNEQTEIVYQNDLIGLSVHQAVNLTESNLILFKKQNEIIFTAMIDPVDGILIAYIDNLPENQQSQWVNAIKKVMTQQYGGTNFLIVPKDYVKAFESNSVLSEHPDPEKAESKEARIEYISLDNLILNLSKKNTTGIFEKYSQDINNKNLQWITDKHSIDAHKVSDFLYKNADYIEAPSSTTEHPCYTPEAMKQRMNLKNSQPFVLSDDEGKILGYVNFSAYTFTTVAGKEVTIGQFTDLNTDRNIFRQELHLFFLNQIAQYLRKNYPTLTTIFYNTEKIAITRDDAYLCEIAEGKIQKAGSEYKLDDKRMVASRFHSRGPLLEKIFPTRKEFRKNSNTLCFLIANKNTPMPKENGNFKQVKDSQIHQGWVVFRGLGEQGQAGIYTVQVNPVGIIEVVANKKTLIPQGAGYFGFFGTPEQDPQHKTLYGSYNAPSARQLITRNDKKVVKIAFYGSDTYQPQQAGIYLAKKYDPRADIPYDLKLVANQDTYIPNSQHKFSSFSGPYLNDGHVSFRAAGPNDYEGIFVRRKGQLQIMYDTNSPVPEGKGNFTQLWNPSFDAGLVAFVGRGEANQEGLYWGDGKTLQKVADLNTSLPSTYSKFATIGGPSLQGGKIAFRGTGENGENAIFLYDGYQLNTIVDLNSPIPADEHNSKFNYFSNPTLNQGNVIFIGGRVQESPHKEKTNLQTFGVYIYLNGIVQKIVDCRDTIDSKPIKNLQLGPVSLSENMTAIHVTFEDDTEALYGIDDLMAHCKTSQYAGLKL